MKLYIVREYTDGPVEIFFNYDKACELHARLAADSAFVPDVHEIDSSDQYGTNNDTVIIGQECITCFGMGRVVEYDYAVPRIKVKSKFVEGYIGNVRWFNLDEVELIDPRK